MHPQATAYFFLSQRKVLSFGHARQTPTLVSLHSNRGLSWLWLFGFSLFENWIAGCTVPLFKIATFFKIFNWDYLRGWCLTNTLKHVCFVQHFFIFCTLPGLPSCFVALFQRGCTFSESQCLVKWGKKLITCDIITLLENWSSYFQKNTCRHAHV